jgi:N-acetylglutamate synthase-like GNAT family acetyltransferase
MIEEVPSVRLATPGDEDEIFAICKMLHAENGLFPMSESAVRSRIRECTEQKGGIIGVIGAPGQIEAIICLILNQFWYSSAWSLDEQFAFVLPNCRKSSNAKELIIFAKACATALQLPLVIGVLSNERTEAKVRLYERQLGSPAGAYFLVGTKTGYQQEASL